MRRRALKKFTLKTILTTIGLLYISFLYIDITGIELSISSDEIKYIAIVLCLLISLLIGEDYINKRDRVLLQLGICFTALADLCLLIYSHHTLGVAIFCIVQILYSFRYDSGSARSILKTHISILAIIVCIFFIVDISIVELEPLLAIACFYAVLLIANVHRSIKTLKDGLFPYPNNYIIMWGMLLFFLCDINVALYNIIENYGNYYVLIWFFYLPSQVFLAISGWKLSEL